MKIAIVGATGLVGNTMAKILSERKFPVSELIPVASERSRGKSFSYNGKEYTLRSLPEALNEKPQIALFSAGGDVSREWAQRFADAGCYVIDNSSAWRMDPDKKLIVPEVNAAMLSADDRIIANPNCSTIQMVMVLKPLQERYGLARVVVSTYQSVTGSGQKGVQQLLDERMGLPHDSFYPYQIDLNILPHIDVFQENGYTREEMKMILETRKILNDPDLKVTATTVRVPVTGGHSESVNIALQTDFQLEDIRQQLAETPGLKVCDNPAEDYYPTPLMAAGKDDVLIGRLRRDFSQPNTLNCWIVADNLRKGAATNAVQIAEYVADHFLAGGS